MPERSAGATTIGDPIWTRRIICRRLHVDDIQSGRRVPTGHARNGVKRGIEDRL